MEEEITLTLPQQDEEEEIELTLGGSKKEEEAPKPVDKMEDALSEKELQQVEAFADTIDITESNVILQYGSDAQKKIVDFSDSALNKVRTKDLGEVGDMISKLVIELKGFDTEEDEKGFFGKIKKPAKKIQVLKTKYEKAEVNVDKIVDMLEDYQIQLMKDITLLDELYKHNLTNYKQLTMYILAGKKALEKARNEDLQKLIDKAQRTGLPEDSQAANDYSALCDRFDKKLHDLELTRMVSIQMGPQIRLVQNNDTIMAEKIQSTIVNTIPLWKSQMVLALGVEHSRQAMEAQREVSEMTNELLKKNADTLKMASVDTAKEAEKGIVEIETLQYTNRQLIDTLDEVMKIHNDGRQQRREAEVELQKIENELKGKLLEINK